MGEGVAASKEVVVNVWLQAQAEVLRRLCGHCAAAASNLKMQQRSNAAVVQCLAAADSARVESRVRAPAPWPGRVGMTVTARTRSDRQSVSISVSL